MVLIRDAQPDDAPALARVHVASWRSTYAGLLPGAYLTGMSVSGAEARWRRSLPDRGLGSGTLVAAESDGGPVGFVSVGPQRYGVEGFPGEVYALYLHDDVHGLGLGRALMAAGAERMMEAGVRSGLVWCLATNPARWFYERLGGVRVAERPGRFAGQPIIEVAYGWHDLARLTQPSTAGQRP